METKCQLDRYSIMIVAKYFYFEQDFYSIQMVCKKLQNLCEYYKYNPVSSSKLFPNIETQYLYYRDDIKLPGMYHYVICYPISYTKYLKEKDDITEFRKVFVRNEELTVSSGNTVIVPEGVTHIDNYGFSYVSGNVKLPSTVKVIGKRAFTSCYYPFQKYKLNEGLIIIEEEAFIGSEFREITFPSTLKCIKKNAFKDCRFLRRVTFLNEKVTFEVGAFSGCNQLISNVTLPGYVLS